LGLKQRHDFLEFVLEFSGGLRVFLELVADDLGWARGSSSSLGLAADRGDRKVLAR
jgi:hypothetical protein